jgi:hypothetical protein
MSRRFFEGQAAQRCCDFPRSRLRIVGFGRREESIR